VIAIGTIVVVDQITKFVVGDDPALREARHHPELLDVTHVQNTGAAFGLLNAADFPYKSAVMIGIATLALVAITIYARQLGAHERLSRYGLALILGRRVRQPDRSRHRRLRRGLRRRLLGGGAFLGLQRRRRRHHHRGHPRAARDGRDRTPPCIPSCLISAASRSTPTASCSPPAYLLGLQFALMRAARARPRRPARHGPGIWIIISALVGAKLLLLIVDSDSSRATRASCSTCCGRAACSTAADRGGRRRAALSAPAQAAAVDDDRRVRAGIALGHVVGRLGCLMAGCCFGKPTSCRGRSRSTTGGRAHVGTPLGVPLHPTQLYEAGAER
jgi:hypothetical protein